MGTLTYTDTLTIRECPNCHISYAIPEQMYERKSKDGTSWYCPNGHSVVVSDPENKRLRRELENAQARIERKQEEVNRLYAKVETAKRCTAAARGQVTRIKNRIHNGVCPCCNRHFQNLEAHIKREHPDFVESPA